MNARTWDGIDPRGRLRRIPRTGRQLLAAAAIVAGASVGVVAAGPAAAVTTCAPTELGSTGWTGNVTTNPASGWAYTTGPTGDLGWFSHNDRATNQTLTHTVSGAPSSGTIVTFDSYWRQASLGSGPSTASATSNLTVSFGGVVYATISTPGPNSSPQRATVIASNGATISPAFPTRTTGLTATGPTTFSLALPDGVPATGPITFSMSNSNENGSGTNGIADDFVVDAVSVTECVTTIETDLSVAKTGPASVRPGGPISWDVTVRNAGPDAAATWTLTDAVPAGVTDVAVADAGCSVAGSTVTCSGAGLAAGATRTVTITGTAPAVSSSTTLRNTATVSSPDDTDSTNNTDDATTTVDPEVGTPIVNPMVGVAAAGAAALVGLGVRRHRRAVTAPGA